MKDSKYPSNKCSDESIHRSVNTFLMELECQVICCNCGEWIFKDDYALFGRNGIVYCVVCAKKLNLITFRPNTFTNFLYHQAKARRKRLQ